MPYPSGPDAYPGQGFYPGLSPEDAGASWYSLLDVYRETEQLKLDDISRRPVACPNDGTLLMLSSSGALHCPWDGWDEGDTPAEWVN